MVTPVLREAIARLLASPRAYPENRFAGQGIVTCAGGHRYFTCAWVLIWVLRRVVQTKLPIQVWHAGRDEMSEGMQLILEEEGVEVVDAELIARPRGDRVCGGWPLKPYAIANSRFREVLFLDADCVPLTNPDGVFDWDLYRNNGLLLWPDVIDVRKSNPVWQRLGLAPADSIGIESGVLAIDKARAWNLLDVVMALNERWQELYDLIYGDKDSYLLAARLVGRDFGLIESRPFQVGEDLVQRDSHGEPFVHHRTGSKWNLLGVNQPGVDKEIDAACEAALAELRHRWSGAIFNAPRRSDSALAAERELAAIRWFRYVATGQPRRLELLAGGRVGEGRGVREQHWAVVDRGDGDVTLQFYSGVSLAVELTKAADGIWRGGSVIGTPFDVMLVAERDSVGWPGWTGRSSAPHVVAILDPALFAAGFDAEIAEELRQSIALLHRIFDDVVEQVGVWMRTHTLSDEWRRHIEAVTNGLSVHDATLSQKRSRPVSSALNDERYRRVP